MHTELGILGLVYELLSWDKKYERAIMASGSEWIKAIVVKDFETMVALAEHVREQKLPKVKIIPLDALSTVGKAVSKTGTNQILRLHPMLRSIDILLNFCLEIYQCYISKKMH